MRQRRSVSCRNGRHHGYAWSALPQIGLESAANEVGSEHHRQLNPPAMLARPAYVVDFQLTMLMVTRPVEQRPAPIDGIVKMRGRLTVFAADTSRLELLGYRGAS